MSLRPLGRSDIEISAIGLGCWQFSEGRGIVGGYWSGIDADATAAIVRAAIDGGVNWFDTAEAYGNGRSERALRTALKASGKANGDVVIATKWTPQPPRRASSIGRTIGTRKANLAPFAIDLHQVHQPMGSLSGHRAQMNAMADLVDAGHIRAVGVSNFDAAQTRRCHQWLADRGVPLVSNQVRYSIFDRTIETSGVLDACMELGITVIAYSPLAQGLATGRFHRDPESLRSIGRFRRAMLNRIGLEKTRPAVEALERIAHTHEATPAEVALAWLVSFHGDTVVAIPGASKPRQATSNARAMTLALSDAERAEIDRTTRAFR